MIARRRFPVRITVAVRSPFIMTGVDPSEVGIDKPALRDECGRPVLPGDHLKGLLREACLALSVPETSPDGLSIRTIFGAESPAERDAEQVAIPSPNDAAEDRNAPDRGQLRLRDLAAKKMFYPADDDPDRFGATERDIAAWRQKAARGEQAHEGRPDITRIAIDKETGTVARGMLQVVELAAPLGAVALFRGDGVFYGTEIEGRSVQTLLANAIGIVPYFGGLRTVGFGEHCAAHSQIEIGAGEPIGPSAATPTAPPAAVRQYEGTFAQAFLVSALRLADNVYEGSAVIPGSALKGALADMLAQQGIDTLGAGPHARALARMRISHARPLHLITDNDGKARIDPQGQVQFFECDRPLPLSLMRDPSNEALACALGHPTPGLMRDQCADFQPDWKYAWTEDVRTRAARPTAKLAKLGRGHTRIGETGAALDQGLFVEVVRGFGYNDGAARGGDAGHTQPCRFRFTVAYPEIARWAADERAAAADIVAVLETGLDAVGKTNARFTVNRLGESPLTPPNAARGRWRVLLETDAVLVDPDAAEPPGNVERALREYFAEILDGARLVDWYVQRRLVGRYLGMRRRAGSAGYAPWSVFEAGSCFLIEANPGWSTSVAAKLGELLVSGMPVYRRLPTGLVKIDNWRHCPFMAENGFGEISVDDPVFAVADATAGGAK